MNKKKTWKSILKKRKWMRGGQWTHIKKRSHDFSVYIEAPIERALDIFHSKFGYELLYKEYSIFKSEGTLKDISSFWRGCRYVRNKNDNLYGKAIEQNEPIPKGYYLAEKGFQSDIPYKTLKEYCQGSNVVVIRKI